MKTCFIYLETLANIFFSIHARVGLILPPLPCLWQEQEHAAILKKFADKVEKAYSFFYFHTKPNNLSTK